MITIFNEILYRPILNVLIAFYDFFPGHNLGVAIIGVTIVIRLILYPSFSKSLKSQKALQELQPKMNEIKDKHKDNKQAQMQEMMVLYKENNVNPMSSCLPLLIQLPILWALWSVLRKQLEGGAIEGLYSFIANPGVLNTNFFNIINLTEKSVILALIAAIFQYIQAKMVMHKSDIANTNVAGKDNDMNNTAKMLQNQMVYVLPVITFFIASSLPSGLALYWVTSTLFAIVQQWFIIRERKTAIVNM